MKRSLLALLCGFILWGKLSAAPEPTNPAGVVLYAETPMGVELLLADHAAPSQRGWASFGGQHEAGETLAETAARETEEETHGYFKRAAILSQIKDRKPFFDGPFALYFAKVDFVPIRKFLKAPIPAGNQAYAERGPFAWVPYAEIARLLDAGTAAPFRLAQKYLPTERNTDWLWPIWVHNFRAAVAANAVPWIKSPAVMADAAKP